MIATRVGGTPEAIEDGVNGLLVPPADPVALATAIGRVLADPAMAGRLGRAARQSVNERFSIERMVSATEQPYDTLLTKRGRVIAPAVSELACR